LAGFFARIPSAEQNFVKLRLVSIEEVSRAVPVEQRARFLSEAQRVVARARAGGVSELELELSLRVLSALHGAGSSHAGGERT